MIHNRSRTAFDVITEAFTLTQESEISFIMNTQIQITEVVEAS